MKLYELLEVAKRTGDLIVREGSKFAIRYCEAINGFVWCFRYKNGEYSIDKNDKTGYSRLFLNDNVLNDEWNLEPIRKIEPISINGTNFTDYDKAIQYIDTLKRRRKDLHLYEKVCRETGTRPIVLADKETLEFINKELRVNKPLFKLGDKFIVNVIIPIETPKNSIVFKTPYQFGTVECEIVIIDTTSCENNVRYKLSFDTGCFWIFENQLLSCKQI